MIESPSPANVDWMGIVKGEGLYHQKKQMTEKRIMQTIYS
jgi:hypothetical protein